MKIVFCDICMKEPKFIKALYKDEKSDVYVRYPINAVWSKCIKADDEVKVVLLKPIVQDKEKQEWIIQNTKDFEDEVALVNKSVGAKYKIEILETEFTETTQELEKRFKGMVQTLEPNCKIYADITFGPKPLPMVLIGVMNFAEKFYRGKVKKIMYGKVEFVKDENGGDQKIANPELCDVTGIYYLNNLTNSMEAPNAEKALEALSVFLGK